MADSSVRFSVVTLAFQSLVVLKSLGVKITVITR